MKLEMRNVLVHSKGRAAIFYLPGLVASLEDAGWDVYIAESQDFPANLIQAAGMKAAKAGVSYKNEIYAPWSGEAPADAIVAEINGKHGLQPTMKVSLGRYGTVSIASYEQILETLEVRRCKQDFAGKTLLLTMGPTIEDFDPARYISNRSTGRMGVSFARMAARRGANVIAVCGPMTAKLPQLESIESISVRSAKNMGDAVLENIHRADIAILCAAVADFSPCNYSEEKIKKGKSETMTLQMKRNMDILATVGSLANHPYLVGFAAESTDIMANGLDKLERKHCNMLCANDITAPGCGFAGDTNSLHIFMKNRTMIDIPLASKDEIADKVLDIIIKDFE